MRDYEFTVPANGQDPKTVGGNFIKLKSSISEVRIIAETLQGRIIADLRMTAGTSVRTSERYERVRILNATGTSVQAVLILGLGDVQDSELTGTITASKGTQIANAGHTVGLAAAVLLAIDTTRRSVIINNEDATNAIYIGSDATVTAANGLKVSAGQSLALTSAAGAAIYAIGAAAGLVVKTLSELD